MDKGAICWIFTLGPVSYVSVIILVDVYKRQLHMMLYVWLFVPVFLHASQHWALAWSTQQKEGSDTIVNSESRSKIGEIRRLMLPSLVLTLIMLVFPVGSLFGGAVFVSMFIFYVHYFADRVVWRPKS